MILSERQQIFARNVARLILYMAESNYGCTFGEALRTQEMADLYAKQGKGIKNSLHLKRLAIDLNLFREGKYLTGGEHYKQFGQYWATLHPQNRYGGDWDKDGISGEPGEVDFNHFEMREG